MNCWFKLLIVFIIIYMPRLFPVLQAMQNLRHGSNTASNEAQVSTTDTNASKQDSPGLAAS